MIRRSGRIKEKHSKTDSSLFVIHRGFDIAYLLLYVDDIILSASSSVFLQRIIASFHSEFAMTDLGSLNYFIGISSQRSFTGLFLSQSKYVEEILKRANMHKCTPCRTPVNTESKLGVGGDPVSDPMLYRSLAGALQYLTFTRPDISYVVQQVCLYMHDSREPHYTVLKCILCYICGTIDHGLQLHVSSMTQLTAYTDADWAGFPITRRSTLAWLCNLLRELHAPLFTATLVYCDNVSAVYLSTNLVQHQRAKHIEIDIHFVRDFLASGHVCVLHVPSRFHYADSFTKGLLRALFLEFRDSLNVQRPSVSTGREY
ncbi:ribonuclease H-like domain-containing protein [Tanacetum coccineum]